MHVVVDIYERESRVRRALQELGVTTVMRALAVGDYEAGGAIVERKSVRDLHLSIISGRFWRQIARMRRVALRPYVLVEGADLDDGPLRPEAVRGALVAVAELGVPVMRSSDPQDSAAWLKVIGSRRNRRKRMFAPNPSPGPSVAEAMLTAVPGISVVSARALLTHFGTIAHMAEAGPERWLSVPGIGPVRAASLANALSQGASVSSRPRSGRRRPGPST